MVSPTGNRRSGCRLDRCVSRSSWTHLSRQLLHKPATNQLQAACRQAVGLRADTVITADHGLVKWNFHRLLVTLLDSPTHMTR